MIVKVCGMKYPENMIPLHETGTNLMGMIFYDRSPRYFDEPLPELPKNIELAGVFVNSSIDNIIAKTKAYGLDWIQLHGEESPDFCLELKNALKSGNPETGIIKAIPVKDGNDLLLADRYEDSVELFLFDTKGKYRGGNGEQFNWQVLELYKSPVPFLLSGGIGPEDAERVNDFLNTPAGRNCAGIDLNSRFEIKPGLKNLKLIKEFNMKISRQNLEQTNH